jgi:dual specificity protein kinase CLK2/3
MSEIPDHLQLFDLIRRMLDYDPTTRITLGKTVGIFVGNKMSMIIG